MSLTSVSMNTDSLPLEAENDTILLNLFRSSKADSDRIQAISTWLKAEG